MEKRCTRTYVCTHTHLLHAVLLHRIFRLRNTNWQGTAVLMPGDFSESLIANWGCYCCRTELQYVTHRYGQTEIHYSFCLPPIQYASM